MAAPKGNQYGKGRHVGRPLKFKSVEELEKKIDAYFADCDPHVEEGKEWRPVMVKKQRGKETLWIPKKTDIPDDWRLLPYMRMTKQKPYTVTGLALWLGTDRELLISYEKREAYSDIIRRAKALIHTSWEEALWNEKISTSGVIFNLKNNWGWKDRVEAVHEPMETGYEHLTSEEIKAKLDELRRQNGVFVPTKSEAFSHTIRAREALST